MIVGLLVLLIVVLTVLVVVFACKRIKDAERKKTKERLQVYEDDESKKADKNTAVKEPQEPPQSTPAKHSFL